MLLTLYILNALVIVALCLHFDTKDVIDVILHVIGYGTALANGVYAAQAIHLVPGGNWPPFTPLLVSNLIVSLFFAWAWSRRYWKNVLVKTGLIGLTFLNVIAFFQ